MSRPEHGDGVAVVAAPDATEYSVREVELARREAGAAVELRRIDRCSTHGRCGEGADGSRRAHGGARGRAAAHEAAHQGRN
jgi:hypothetical protein